MPNISTYPRFTMDSMLKQNGGPVTISSTFINIKELKPGVVDAIRNATIIAAVQKAVDLWGQNQPLIVRDLIATDMAYTHNIFTENSNAAVGWHVMAEMPFTVRTGAVIGIYGVRLSAVMNATMQSLPITGIQIDVGGSRHAQWHIETLDVSVVLATTVTTYPLGGVTKSPIIAAEDITVTIFEYTRTAGAYHDVDYFPVWLGIVAEKQGITLMA